MLVEISDYYSIHYPEDRYQSYILYHLDPTSFVWAFVERGSRSHMRLEQRLRTGDSWGGGNRMTVLIRRAREGSRPNELELLRVLGKEWLLPPAEEAPAPPSGKAGSAKVKDPSSDS